MAIDNTHTKYLHGKDKKAWSGYKDALQSQKKFDNFITGLNVPKITDGGEYEIPVRKPNK